MAEMAPGCAYELPGELVFTEFLEAVAQAALQRRWRIGIEGDKIPQRLAAIPAEPRERSGVRIRMACHIFADRAIRMLGEFVQSLGVGARMLADEAQQVKVFLRRLLHQFFEHFRLGVGAENEANLFVPRGIDLIELAGAGMDEIFENSALHLQARNWQVCAFERIENAQQMLPLAEDDLGSARNRALVLFLVLHEIGSSHCQMAPAETFPKFAAGPDCLPLDPGVGHQG